MYSGLFHYGVRASDADTTLNFYIRFLDMRIDASRPPMEVTGFWLRAALPDSPPSIHVFTGPWAKVGDQVPQGSGAAHHMALYCKGYDAMRRKLNEYGLTWVGLAVPNARQWQIFVYDPNGIMLELAFDAVAEGIALPEIPTENRYAPGAPWFAFNPAEYAVFAR